MSTTQEVGFAGSTGQHLDGVLHRPDGEVAGSILFAHCFTCSKDLHTTTRVARGLADAGYAVLRFDFTGIGASSGDFSDKTVSHNVRDVIRAATHLIERDHGPCALVGHSLGGAAVLLAAARMRTVRSVVVIGSPASAGHVRHLIADDEEEIRREGIATVDIGGRPFPITRAFLEDLEAHDVMAAVADLGRPLLVLHAVDDRVVPVGEGETLFEAAAQPKAFVPLLDTDHLLTDQAVAARAVDALVAWLRATLGRSDPASSAVADDHRSDQ